MEKTGSAKTTTGGVRTVRLNTYREKKMLCYELEKENEQLSSTVIELQDLASRNIEEIRMLQERHIF
jgi:hypothetical protein